MARRDMSPLLCSQYARHSNRCSFRGIFHRLNLSELNSTGVLLMSRISNQPRIGVLRKRLCAHVPSRKQTPHQHLLICPLSIRVLYKEILTRYLFCEEHRHLFDSDSPPAPRTLAWHVRSAKPTQSNLSMPNLHPCQIAPIKAFLRLIVSRLMNKIKSLEEFKQCSEVSAHIGLSGF